MDERADQSREPSPPGDLGHPRRGPDALTIGLVVFFAALLVTVMALLAAPMLTR